MTTLFDPLKLGSLTLPNRILMAPLTRCRAGTDHLANDLMAEHYAQRARAGLLIAEATMAMPGCSAFWKEPGVHSDAQVAGWRRVTEAVHQAGGRIFLQIWHGGRACHPALNAGQQPVSSTDRAIQGEVHTPEGKLPYTAPRRLEDHELPGIVAGFRHAAVQALAAGFDGIEVHAANGYLIDQFLRDGINDRSGPYGGSLENRTRLLREILDAVTTVWPADRVGVRLSPLNSFNDAVDSDPVGLSTYVGQLLSGRGLAYLHVIRGDMAGQQQGDVLTPLRTAFDGVLIGNQGYDAAEAADAVAQGRVDAIAFGVPFIANPDLPHRLQHGLAWNAANPHTFYSEGAAGYTDYPTAS